MTVQSEESMDTTSKVSAAKNKNAQVEPITLHDKKNDE